jgi:hypothetical protein
MGLQVSELDSSLEGVVQDAPVTEAKDSLERLYREQGAKLWRALFRVHGRSGSVYVAVSPA